MFKRLSRIWVLLEAHSTTQKNVNTCALKVSFVMGVNKNIMLTLECRSASINIISDLVLSLHKWTSCSLDNILVNISSLFMVNSLYTLNNTSPHFVLSNSWS